ncbi:Protein of unknown function (DUF1573) [Aequorivita sublithincola DSM 14238]|uniref:DUF1573 domain-containing protein n=1 Tax=Aequorivita sublithincola (strain DSM 14238 / LMG 21431 / ACAM 643 / 9-3) TaxID=746697 RepID=I3YZ99_AEQSU|nr:DUF1573 domain-containing protein [Aequorivita sublithincola]AFL82317.1 Protein of unknown function (DUF1573) [Aequorivita sublithincola DSM 14238]
MVTTTLKGRSFFRNVFFMASFLFCTALFAQDAAKEDKGIFKFESSVIDYGTIAHNADGVRAFVFKNVGTAPIVISNVKGSCGCTVPTKPDHAIMPGETAEIGVKYATDRIGAFSKTVTVTSNASEGTVLLKIKGNVLADAPAASETPSGK